MKDKFKYFFVSVFILIADQVSKKIIENFFLDNEGNMVNEPIRVIGEEFFRITLVYNPGVAFGIRLGGKYILSSISIILSIFIAYYIIKLSKKKLIELWAFSFILGGALGNLIDRALYGKVVDFLDFDFP